MKVETTIHFKKRGRGKQKVAVLGPVKAERSQGRVPRISKLMALAIRFDDLIRTGQVSTYAELARLGQVTPARVTQIMNLNLLAPAIQEELLFLPRVENGKEEVSVKGLQKVATNPLWKSQRTLFST